MIPVWTTFILCGAVSAVGFTYFMVQLDHLNHKVGRLKLPSVAFSGSSSKPKIKARNSKVKFANSLGISRKFAPSLGIAASMIVAILCCITAAKVEDRRLGVVLKHGLVNKPCETVPMTMFWLLPQFVLLGAFEGIFQYNAICFFADQSPIYTQCYLLYHITGVFGVGIFGSVLLVFVVGKYYWTLAWLMAVNLVIFICTRNRS